MGEEVLADRFARPHVAIYTYPVLGRLIPAMVFASKLADSGAKVSFLCLDHRISRLNEAKSRRLYNPEVEIVRLKLADSEKVRSIPEAILKDFHLEVDLCVSFREFVVSLPDPGLSCVFIDEVTSGLAETARSLNLKNFTFVPESALAFSATMHVRQLAEGRLLPLPASLESVTIPKVITLKRTEFLSLYLPNQVGPQVLRALTDAAVSCHRSKGAFVNTFEQLESSVLNALRSGKEVNPNAVEILPVGPLIPPIIGPPAEHEELLCAEFLSRFPRRSVVFASFGSLRKFSLEQIKVVLEGLEASGNPFIWMLRTDVDYVPESSSKRLILTTWAPQLQILSHDSTGLFMTHCGWNSTSESIHYGVPMLVTIPEFMDQRMNGNLVVETFKAGIKLESLDKDCISRSIKSVMESEEIAINVEKLKSASQEGVKIGYEKIKDFLNKLISST